ncbi:HotDog domain-containing protein [Dichotomocladium elegans]|nr:HotDog domain-containing protein [Dichotomocladium elegans]
MPEGFKPDLSKAVGYKAPVDFSVCTRRDYILYALSVGVPEDELHWLYENEENFGPLPTYPLCLLSRGDDWDVNDFIEQFTKGGPVPGIPEWDISRMVHGEQSIEVINPFPVVGGRFKLVKTVKGVYDKGSGMVLHSAVDIYGEKDNVHYCSMDSHMFIRGYGGWNGPKGPKTIAYTPPSRPADVIDEFHTARNQALLFRLSGDFNALHADVRLAPLVGFERPILHGLCSYAKCAHSVLKHFGDNNRLRFKSFSARFANPVLPGETVRVHMWKVDHPEPRTEAVVFVAKVDDRVVISNGFAVLHKEVAESSKL